ncbi:MAG TPA: arsenite methyltransferase [bacterium]|nr:arsenite methyltransferase [bacterium]
MKERDGKDEVREQVSRAYTQAVRGGGCCSGAPVQKGVAAKLAGYSREELEALPAEAVVNSFGCGNPLAYSEVKEGEVVLDLGSGAGIDILLAGKKVGPRGRAIGIDMTDEMLGRARENIAASGLTNVEVRKGIIEDLPVESGSVDWVISNCVINLSPDKPRVFAEIARVLKPGGRMQVSDIVVKDLPAWVRDDKALYNSCIAGAVSEQEYLDGLKAEGLTDVMVKERLVYDAAQIGSLIQSELADGAGGCCGMPADNPIILEAAREFQGKVWSAKICARKPG